MGSATGRWVLTTAVLGTGLTFIDATAVNVALDQIGTDLGAGFTGLQWTVNAYALTLAAFILIGGSLGDHFGRRRVFVIGVVWFALASLGCGLAPDIGTLIAARALQGVGGALLTPGSLALISASFHGPDRAAAIGAWSGLSGIAGAIGPFLGGWLVEWNWRTIFLINLPLAALIVIIALRHVPESRDTESAPGLDVAGTVVGAVGLGALTYGLTGLGERGPDPLLLAAAGLGLLALLAFVFVERRSPHPSVPPSLFANTTFSAANAATLLVYGALGVVFVLLVLQLQVVAGFTALAAGTALLPIDRDHAGVLRPCRRAGRPDRAAAADDPGAAGERGRPAPVAASRPDHLVAHRRPASRGGIRRRADADRRATDLHRARRRPGSFRRRRVGRQQRGRPRGRAAGRGGGARARRNQRGRLHRPRRLLRRLPHRDDDVRRAAGRGRGGGLYAAAPPAPRVLPRPPAHRGLPALRRDRAADLPAHSYGGTVARRGGPTSCSGGARVVMQAPTS